MIRSLCNLPKQFAELITLNVFKKVMTILEG